MVFTFNLKADCSRPKVREGPTRISSTSPRERRSRTNSKRIPRANTSSRPTSIFPDRPSTASRLPCRWGPRVRRRGGRAGRQNSTRAEDLRRGRDRGRAKDGPAAGLKVIEIAKHQGYSRVDAAGKARRRRILRRRAETQRRCSPAPARLTSSPPVAAGLNGSQVPEFQRRSSRVP